MKYLPAVAVAIILAAPQAAWAQSRPSFCGQLAGAGAAPVDYRKSAAEHAGQLAQLERGLFPSDAEPARPATGAMLEPLLQTFPNHTPALALLARQALKDKSVQLQGMRYPVECYFDRAQRLAPDDAGVYATYANYVYSLGLNGKAIELYRRASELDGANPALHYNLGLAYFKQKQYAEANQHAQRAYDAGFPLPGLKNMLAQAGKWQPLPKQATPPAAAPAGATTQE